MRIIACQNFVPENIEKKSYAGKKFSKLLHLHIDCYCIAKEIVMTAVPIVLN